MFFAYLSKLSNFCSQLSLLSFLSVQNGNVTESPDRRAFGSLFLNCVLVYMKSWLYYVETEVLRCVAGIRKFENPFHSERRIIKHHNNSFFLWTYIPVIGWLYSRPVTLGWFILIFEENKRTEHSKIESSAGMSFASFRRSFLLWKPLEHVVKRFVSNNLR